MSKKSIIITGSSGLVGSEAVKYFADKFDYVIGIDNNQRNKLFGTSVEENGKSLKESVDNFVPIFMDINDVNDDFFINIRHLGEVQMIIHTAAQPSHDWATENVMEDFRINAQGSVVILEAMRRNCPDAVFIYCSTNKVYGDYPNDLSYKESDTRYTLDTIEFQDDVAVLYKQGFDEHTPIDFVKHSFFGCSKLAADLYVQEYGQYLGMKTGVFRCGCITGPNHAGAELHGFLSYLVKCVKENIPYTIYGYKGKQVRDNIHSYDLVTAFNEFYNKPIPGAVFNLGGGPANSCSVLEAIELVQTITGNTLKFTIGDDARIGDHKWWITDNSHFKASYPNWEMIYDLDDIIEELCNPPVEEIIEDETPKEMESNGPTE